MGNIDAQTAYRQLIEFAASQGYTVTAGETTRGETDVFESKMHTSNFADGTLHWAWFNSVTNPRFSCSICFKEGEGRVVSYGAGK